MGTMMLKPNLDRLSTKIDRIRRTYTVTMSDLYMVSCYIRKFGPKQKLNPQDDAEDSLEASQQD